MSVSPVSRPTSDDLWTRAAASLSKDDQANLDFQRPDKLEILSDLLSITEKEIQRCEKGRISFRRKSGEKVFARDLFAKVVRWIEHFKQVGDVAVQYDPVHASLPWAGIRFLLEVTVSDFNAAELILEHATSLAELIPRYTIFEQIFLQSASPAASELGRSLTALYSRMLLYLAHAKAYFQHGTLKQLDQHFELKTILRDMDAPLRRMGRTVDHIQDTLDASKRTSILQWLSAEPYQKHHKQTRSDFLSGTGAWLLADPIYKKWKDESASSILWLHGIPGSGKSKLVSAVIEDTRDSSQKGQSPLPVYFYCSRNPAEPGRSIPSEIVASIARQLARVSPSGPLLPPAITKYEEEEETGFAGGRLTMDESRSLIIDLLALHPVATIIIDALDECDPDTRGDILDVFTDILQNSATLVKLFVSSRDDQDIVYQLKNYPNLDLSSDKNSVDIVHFVRSETDRLIARKMLLRSTSNGTEMKKAIVAKVSEDANGMFRWASLQLQALCQLKTDQAIRERLGKNPPQLEELYQEILSRIEQYPAEADRQYALNAFRWLLYVRRRLAKAEFLVAVSTQVASSTTLLSLEQVLDLCCNLVIFDSTLNTFRFAHLSVREFLQQQPDLCADTSHGIAAEVCLLSIITRSDADETQNFLSRWNYSQAHRDVLSTLHDYGDTFWAVHCQAAGCMRLSGSLQALLSFFMAYDERGSPPFRIWHTLLDKTMGRLGFFNPLSYLYNLLFRSG
ncbi:hypothetical protein BJY00DRAFT_326112 [Aspergillus carlsbadensis]|nr:hypothetical protein BJY00DRAFT_326112 [Aspergillus carlsbadensis]